MNGRARTATSANPCNNQKGACKGALLR
jgi:hypothetical protein